MKKWYIALWIGAFLAIPLWREFHETNQLVWNVSLAIFLIGIIVAAVVGLRYLEKNPSSVGEARFKAPRRDLDGS